MTKPASRAISLAASLIAGPLFTAPLAEEDSVAGVLDWPPAAATEPAVARLAAASAAAEAAGGLAGSFGRPAADV